MSKYVPAIFQPTVRPSWCGILSYISNEEKAQILEAIIKYPEETDIQSAFWENTIKPDLECQYIKFTKSCYAKGRSSKLYWENSKKEDMDNISIRDDKDMDKISLPYDYHMDNISLPYDKDLKGKDKGKDNVKDKDEDNVENDVKVNTSKQKKYGELGYVLLREDQYNDLKEKHANIDVAIEILDTWLGTSGSKNRYKNHYAYFKINSWVWDRVKDQQARLPDDDRSWLDAIPLTDYYGNPINENEEKNDENFKLC